MRSNAASASPLQGLLTPEFVSSLRDRDRRDRYGLFLAEGLRFLCTAVDTGYPISGLVVCRKLLHGALAHTLIRRAGVPTLELSEAEFVRLSAAEEPQGVLLILRQAWHPLPQRVGPRDIWLGVERIRTPGNLGTLMRSASAVGATGVMVFAPARDRADPFDPSCVRASMGSCFRMRVVGTTHREFRSWRHRHELMVVGADGGADRDYRQVKYRRPVLLMLGNERDGLSEEQLNTCDGFMRIPMVGEVDSLNVAMAGSVLLYEAWSQRNPVKGRR